MIYQPWTLLKEKRPSPLPLPIGRGVNSNEPPQLPFLVGGMDGAQDFCQIFEDFCL